VLAVKHAGVSGVGFAVDLALLHAAIGLGLEPAWARVISLGCAMQVTFVVNGLYVFRTLRHDRRGLAGQWASYLVTNAFGNLCNYWIFVTLVSLHHPVVSRPVWALCLASLSAWGLNYGAARLLVFGVGRALRPSRPRAPTPAPRGGPSPAGPGSSRR
jgi:putative flippase GtrA